MDKRTIVLVSILFGLIILGMFTFAFLSKTERDGTMTPTVPEKGVLVAYPDITRIDAKHFFSEGTHTFAGELVMPTPCDLVDVTAIVEESYPEKIRLDFVVINNADNCAQMLTTQRFMVAVSASETATAQATFMGRAVELNLIPALPGETPEDFELFIKG